MKISIFVGKNGQERIFGEKYYARLRKYGDVALWNGADDFSNRAEVLDFIKDSDFIITSWGTPVIDKEIIDSFFFSFPRISCRHRYRKRELEIFFL